MRNLLGQEQSETEPSDSDFSDDIDGSFQDEDALITPVKPWDVFVVNSIF